MEKNKIEISIGIANEEAVKNAGYARGAIKLCVVLGMATALGGCAISELTGGFGSNWFTGSGSQKSVSAENGVSEERLLAAAKTDSDNSADIMGSSLSCPKFAVWPRDRNLTIYEEGRPQDGLAIKYRGEITKTARECEISPDYITVKYGFAGRVLLGPRGARGDIHLPVLVHVTDKNRDKVNSETVDVKVTISPDQPIGYFSLVRRISFKIPPGTPTSHYKLYVAFKHPPEG